MLIVVFYENIYSNKNANTDIMEGIKFTFFITIGVVAFTSLVALTLVSNNVIKILLLFKLLSPTADTVLKI